MHASAIDDAHTGRCSCAPTALAKGGEGMTIRKTDKPVLPVLAFTKLS